VAQRLGFPAYAELIRDTAASEEGARRREHVESIVRQAIAAFLQSGPAPAVEYLVEAAAVPSEESLRVFSILEAIRGPLQTDHELDGLVRALRGEYIEPGPGADIIQNPAVLPTGRNTHAVNPYVIPSPIAVRRAEPVVQALLDRHLKEAGRYPET